MSILNKIILIAATETEASEQLFALTSEGEIFVRKDKRIEFKGNFVSGKGFVPDVNGESTASKYFPYWEKVKLNTHPEIPEEFLAAMTNKF